MNCDKHLSALIRLVGDLNASACQAEASGQAQLTEDLLLLKELANRLTTKLAGLPNKHPKIEKGLL